LDYSVSLEELSNDLRGVCGVRGSNRLEQQVEWIQLAGECEVQRTYADGV